MQKRAIPLLRAYVKCEIDHLIKECPSKDNLKTSKNPETPICNDRSSKSGLKPKSPPRLPPKRQILPQTTMNLIRSQVMEFQEINIEMDLAKSPNHPTTLAIDATTKFDANLVVNPKKEALDLTTLSLEKDARICLIEKSGIVGNTDNQEDQISRSNVSSNHQESMQPSPRSKVNPPKDSSTISQASVETIVNHEQA